MMTVHTDAPAACEIQRVDGMRVTTAARTAFDIGRRRELVEGVQRVDVLMNATDVKFCDFEAVVAAHQKVHTTGRIRDSGDGTPSATRGWPKSEGQISG
jgi:hypothetical protein